MSAFRRELAARATDPAGRRWLYVPYDQLTDAIGPLAREDPRELGIVVVENPSKAARRPYHRQKLALILANLRQFALEQAARGVAVRHEIARGSYRDALEPLVGALGSLRMMAPAERELQVDLAPLAESGGLTVLPHEGWLTTAEHFTDSQHGPPWRMDVFYRHVRRVLDVLMDGRRPRGGRWSFDQENRRPWRGTPPAAVPPAFTPDAVTLEVGELIEGRYAAHPGTLDLSRLPATRADAEATWAWARASCLPLFGPYEDAMSTTARTLFHTRISSLVNLHRLLPARVLDEALALDLPLASLEGFVRQLLGWREFMHHVFVATDGFRDLGDRPVPVAAHPGDGGYARWAGQPWPASDAPLDGGDGGAIPSHLGSQAPLPPAYWGTPSGLSCLDHVATAVWDEGYSHHITRLMILANLASLLDVSPREVTDWFWVAYVDAYDWVVEPNVLAMGVFGVGDLMTTKPYIAGAAYINRMSDFCRGCAFDPRRDCPITPLYWAYLARHEASLRRVPRMEPVFRSLARRSAADRGRDAAVFADVSARLLRGERLRPATPSLDLDADVPPARR